MSSTLSGRASTIFFSTGNFADAFIGLFGPYSLIALSMPKPFWGRNTTFLRISSASASRGRPFGGNTYKAMKPPIATACPSYPPQSLQ